MSGGNPETWHRLFRRTEQQAIARDDLGLGTAAVEDDTAFAAGSHDHVPADITGLDDYLSSVVGGLLVEGSGIDLAQDSITGAITIAATGGGGGNADGRAHVVPTLTDFTWVNQGSAVAAQQSFGIAMQQPGLSSASIAALVRSAPSTPYTIVARLKTQARLTSFVGCGLLWRNSSSGALQTIRRYFGSSPPDMRLTNYSSPTTAVSEQASILTFTPLPEWYRISDDGTNRKVEVSADGYYWAEFWSGGRTSYLTPDQVGIYIDNYQSGTPRQASGLALLSWEVA